MARRRPLGRPAGQRREGTLGPRRRAPCPAPAPGEEMEVAMLGGIRPFARRMRVIEPLEAGSPRRPRRCRGSGATGAAHGRPGRRAADARRGRPGRQGFEQPLRSLPGRLAAVRRPGRAAAPPTAHRISTWWPTSTRRTRPSRRTARLHFRAALLRRLVVRRLLRAGLGVALRGALARAALGLAVRLSGSGGGDGGSGGGGAGSGRQGEGGGGQGGQRGGFERGLHAEILLDGCGCGDVASPGREDCSGAIQSTDARNNLISFSANRFAGPAPPYSRVHPLDRRNPMNPSTSSPPCRSPLFFPSPAPARSTPTARRVRRGRRPGQADAGGRARRLVPDLQGAEADRRRTDDPSGLQGRDRLWSTSTARSRW